MPTTAESHAPAPRSAYPSLNSSQVAERLRVSEATLFRLLRRGEAPPSYKIGKRRLWRESDLLDWLETKCREVS
jgi:excisionase family DNA binding protein